MAKNINKDYLVTLDIKRASIINNAPIVFNILDLNTCNIFVNMVINMSNNELISKYVNVENAEDFDIEMNVIFPNNDYKVIRAELLDRENAIYEFDLPSEFTQFIGSYKCEMVVKCNISEREEIAVSERLTYEVVKSITNDLENIKDAQGKPIINKVLEDLENKANKSDIPTKTSQLENDSNFVNETYVTDAINNAKLEGNEGIDLTIYQKKTDNTLNTTDKTVVGAINEVKTKADSIKVPTKVSELENDGGFITAENIPNIEGLATKEDLNAKADVNHNHDEVYSKLGHTHSQYLTEHQDISNLATKEELKDKADKVHTHSQYLTEHQDISGKADKTELHSHANKTILDGITQEDINNWNNSGSSDFSGDYNDLTNKPVIPKVTNDLTNSLKANYDTAYEHSQSPHAPANAQKNSDITKAEIEAKLTGNIATHTHSQYLTEHQSLSDYALKTQLHTHTNKDALDMIIGAKIDEWNNKSDFSGSYNDLTDKPIIPTVPTNVSAFTNDSGYLTSVPSEYVTDEELEAKGYLTQHQDLSDYAKKDTLTTVSVASNTLTLTVDKYQYTQITGNTTITLPNVSEFIEIHLFFNLASGFAGTISLSSTTQIRYQQELTFEASNGYELILTQIPSMGWLVGLVKYEGEGNIGSVGDIIDTPEIIM